MRCRRYIFTTQALDPQPSIKVVFFLPPEEFPTNNLLLTPGIGQELAYIETKAILAMTIRTFDFQIAYEEVGKLKGDGSGYPSLTDGILEQFGERAYQIQLGTAKPNEGMPCRVRSRK